jgi:hypothetical protein
MTAELGKVWGYLVVAYFKIIAPGLQAILASTNSPTLLCTACTDLSSQANISSVSHEISCTETEGVLLYSQT